MATVINPAKIRLAAPDQIVIDADSQANAFTLGATQGGLTITYKPSYQKVTVDQSPVEVAAFRDAETASVELTLAEMDAKEILAAMGYGISGVTTVVAGTLAAIGSPSLTVVGTPATGSFSYQVFAYSENGDGVPCTAVTIATGPTALSTTNYIAITLPPLPAGAIGFGIIRSAGGTSQGLLARVDGSMTTFDDTGLTASAYTASAAQPATPNTDSAYIGGSFLAQVHQLDIWVPKNDGTNNHWHFTAWKAYMNGEVQIDFKRDKATEYKMPIDMLGNLSMPAGQQLFRLVEEY